MDAVAERLQLSTERVVARLRAMSVDSRLAVAVLVVTILLRLNHFGLPQDNYDEGVYLASLRAMAAGHPLFTQVYSAQPPGFLLLIYPWYVAFGQTLAAARLGVIVYSLVGVGAAWYLGSTLGGSRAGLIAVALVGFDPLFLAQSRAVQAEAPAIACALLALAIAAPLRRRPGLLRAGIAGAAFSLSLLIKLFTLPALLPLLAFALAPFGRDLLHRCLAERRWPTRGDSAALWRAGRGTLAALGIGYLALLALVLLPFIGAAGALWNQVIGLHVAARGVNAGQSSNLALLLGIWWEYPLVLAGALAAYLGWRQRIWSPVIMGVWGLLCLLVLLAQRPLFDHHLVLLAPPCALAAAFLPQVTPPPAALRLPRWLRQVSSPRSASLLLALVFLISLGKSVGQEAAEQRQPPTALIQVASDVQAFTQPGDVVVTDDQIIVDLAGRAVPPGLVDTSMVRVASGSLTTAQVIAAASGPHVTAVLWYSGRFDALPGLRAWVQDHFVAVMDYGQGRALYVRAFTPGRPVGIGGFP